MAQPTESAAALAEDRAAAPGALRVGLALRQAREKRGLTREDAGRRLRSTARQVQALEEGRTVDLPPHPYARGLVVAYAALLGLDPDAAAQEWGRPPGDDAAGRRSIFRVPIRTRSSWRDWAVPIACACGTVVAVALGPAFKPATFEFGEPQPSLPLVRRPGPQPVAADLEAPPPAGTREGRDLVVSLRAEAATWIEVSADGEEPRRQELRPGEGLELTARQRLGLALGDAGAVRVSVNSRELGFIGDKGEIRTGIVFEAPRKTVAPRGGTAGQ